MARSCGHADLRDHGRADGRARERHDGHALRRRARVAARRDGPDVSPDECVPFSGVAEADLGAAAANAAVTFLGIVEHSLSSTNGMRLCERYVSGSEASRRVWRVEY